MPTPVQPVVRRLLQPFLNGETSSRREVPLIRGFGRCVITLTAFFGVGLSTSLAETVQTDDYIAIGIEAEDYVGIEDRWVPTDATTPAQSPDPDGNHSSSASEGGYMEAVSYTHLPSPRD